QNVGNQVAPNPRIQNAGNQNRLIGVQGNGIQNQIRNGNLVAVRAEGNAAGQNGNQIRCYNCRGIGHYARNCTARPRRREAAYLQTQLLIAQKEEAGIQLQAEEYDLMAAVADLDEIEKNDNNVISEVTDVEQDGETVNGLIGVLGNVNQNVNGNLVAARAEGNATGHNGIQLHAEEFDVMAAAVDLDEIEEVNVNYGSAEVHDYENCDNNEISNMFTQEEQYTELLEPIPELHQVLHNDNNVIYEERQRKLAKEQRNLVEQQSHANAQILRYEYELARKIILVR
nr:hypothetical protein [Tanacetum cinerariifolium]